MSEAVRPCGVVATSERVGTGLVPDNSSNPSNFILPDLQWMRLAHPPAVRRCQGLFLDRDGVIIEERHYLADPAGVKLLDGAAALIRTARAGGWAVIVVSNQSGIGRGLLDWGIHQAIESRMLEILSEQDAHVDASLACPHHPEAVPPYRGDHAWRKPRPGMLLAAAEALQLDLAASLIIGDRATDLVAGYSAGLERGVHVMTGHGSTERAKVDRLVLPEFRIDRVTSLAEVRPEQLLGPASDFAAGSSDQTSIGA